MTDFDLIDQMTPEQMRSALHRVLDLCNAADPNGAQIPTNGTLLLSQHSGGWQNVPETETVWVRSDDEGTPEDPALNEPLFYPVGNPAEPSDHRRSMGELLWLDDPACDRGSVSLEAYLPLDAIVDAIAPPCATCNGSGQTVDRGSLGVSECQDCGGNQR